MTWRVLLVAAWAFAASAQAHLMPAQRGTLNFTGGGAYLVLSVPVSAFAGVGDVGDGRLSPAEVRVHRAAIEAQVRAGVRLADGKGPLPLEGVILSPASDDETPGAPASQLVVLGRFDMGAAMGTPVLHVGLFGAGPGEQQYDITVTRGSKKQQTRFTREQADQRLFPPAWPIVAVVVGLVLIFVMVGLSRRSPYAITLTRLLRARAFIDGQRQETSHAQLEAVDPDGGGRLRGMRRAR